MNFLIRRCFKNPSRKFKIKYHSTSIMGTLHEDLYTFITQCLIRLRMGNVSDKSCNEYTNTFFRLISSSVIIQIYCTGGHATDDNIQRRMRFSCSTVNVRMHIQSRHILQLFFCHGNTGSANAHRRSGIRNTPELISHPLHQGLPYLLCFLIFPPFP